MASCTALDMGSPIARATPAGRHRIRVAALGTVLFVVSLLGTTLLPGPAHSQERTPEATQDEPTPAIPSVLAQFTTGVEDREPIDQVTFVSNEVKKIYFFSDLRGLAGQTVTHRWTYDGEAVAEVRFDVGGPRWRVWSSKDLLEGWVGDWTVEIVRADGEVLAAETFTYSAPDA